MTLALALVTYLPATTIVMALALGALATMLHALRLCPVEPVTTTATEGYCAETLSIIASVLERCAAPLPTWGGEVSTLAFGLPSPCLWDAPGMMNASDAERSLDIDVACALAGRRAIAAAAFARMDTGCMDTLATPVDYLAAGRFLAGRRAGRNVAWAGAGPTPVVLVCPR